MQLRLKFEAGQPVTVSVKLTAAEQGCHHEQIERPGSLGQHECGH